MRERQFTLQVDKAHLGQFAQNTARELRPVGKRSGHAMSKALLQNLDAIRGTFRRCSGFGARDSVIPREIEWLLDNRYIAEREGRGCLNTFKETPPLPFVKKEGRAVVSLLARALCESGYGRVDEERIELFLENAQNALSLSAVELSLFATALKAELIGIVAHVCREIDRFLQLRRGEAESEPFAAELALQKAGDSGGDVSEKVKALAEEASERHSRLQRLIGNAFDSLRLLSSVDMEPILQRVDRVERELMKDPLAVYPKMDDASRSACRHELGRLAKKHGITSLEAASRAIKLANASRGIARHVAYYIFERPLGLRRRRRTGHSYIASIVLPSALLAALCGVFTGTVWAPFLLLIPLSSLVKNTVDFFALRVTRPRHILRIEKPEETPEDAMTICVISTLLSSVDDGKRLAGQLEKYSITNRDAGEYLRFGILADLPDSTSRTTKRETESVAAAKHAIDRLNEKYGGGFYLFFRERLYNEREKKFAAAERKRGAINELMRLITGQKSTLNVLSGDREAVGGFRYVLALDSDTRLNSGAAAQLVGAMMHPLNRPVINPQRHTVIRGYGLIQPRIGVDLEAAGRSPFAAVYAGQGGIDPYSSAVSDVYMDLFGEGCYTGKGIIDVGAFMACLEGRFPKERILSHDLLEGSYLRSGFIGDVELSDGYPYKVNSYFSRLHRWTRGDWQLLPRLFPHVRNEAGRHERNTLNSLSRWKIFDNLRRSMFAPTLFAALFIALLQNGRAFWVTALATLLCLGSNLLITAAVSLFRHGRNGRSRYHSSIATGVKGDLLRTLLQLLLLPAEAWTCFSAAVTALFRMAVTKRHLLSWVTAADAERRSKDSLFAYYTKFLSAPAAGAAAAIFSPAPLGKALGIFWAAAPLISWLVSRPRQKKEPLSQPQRAFLERQAALIWSWFAEFCSEEDNHLPPDNFQEQPAAGIAHRSSPTNIGLAALAALSAVDLKLLSAEKGLAFLERLLASIEKLEKWNGHLYNWYDTQTLKPLHPRCVSTVDSGNFVGCMIALHAGLSERTDTHSRALAARAKQLADNCRFGMLYDESRRLFLIGFDLEKNAPMSGWYDLMASEARLTSYIAIARGDVPRKHWGRLSRALMGIKGYKGMASWTGTMFEYLMPNLLMPCYENSLIYESNQFCVMAQRARTNGSGVPWGISESAYYAFDNSLNYQYKAHGVQRLGLKRGLDAELVVSPYSSFLALLVDPRAAARNLARMAERGFEGQYGMFEAADYTVSRQADGSEMRLVRCYMAHHIGMSLIAITNVLRDNVMQKRFMANIDMRAFSELLEEKVPVGAPVLRHISHEIPERAARTRGEQWRMECGSPDIFRPRCTLLSNASYSLLLSDCGHSRAECKGLRMYRFEPVNIDAAPGIGFFLKLSGRLMPLCALHSRSGSVQHSAVFEADKVVYHATGHGIAARMTVSVSSADNCEVREIHIDNHGYDGDIELVCVFEPVLEKADAFESHPAFSKLNMETELRDGTLVISRRPRDNIGARSMAVALDCDGYDIDTARESALGRGGLPNLEQRLREPAEGTLGAVLDPCVVIRKALKCGIGDSTSVRMALSFASRAADAISAATRAAITGHGGESRINQIAEKLGLGASDIGFAMSFLSDLTFVTDSRAPFREAAMSARPGPDALWRFGISGDLPIIVTEFRPDELAYIKKVMAWHLLLTRCGYQSDLCIVARDGGEYHRPLATALSDMMKELGCEGTKGARGGVHILDIDGSQLQALEAYCSLYLEKDAPSRPRPPARPPTQPFFSTAEYKTGEPEQRFFDDGSFCFCTGTVLPPLSWCHTLANEHFGYTATETGSGHMWYLNARENKLTPWTNDPLQTSGRERLRFKNGAGEYSLFADGGGECSVTYGFGFAQWRRSGLTLTAFVPKDTNARVFLIETDSPGEIEWCLEPMLCSDYGNSIGCISAFDGAAIHVSNPRNLSFPGQTAIFASGNAPQAFTCDRDAYYAGDFDGACGALFSPCVALRYPAKDRLVLVCGCFLNDAERESILRLTDPEAARRSLEETKRHWRRIVDTVKIKTPSPRFDSYMNGWALYQTLACRIFGRSSIYQCGGAYGFRDQLQDCGAMIAAAPQTVRSHILLAASRQFLEGDAQHWWHPELSGNGKGVRTRYTDDLLWLPYTVAQYVIQTGDTDILDEPVHWLDSPVLADDEDERYESPSITAEADSLLEHCIRALEQTKARGLGEHGLCHIGGGDWNDGFNRIGEKGRGESVWLTWFYAHTLESFAPLLERRGRAELAEDCLVLAKEITKNANRAWDEDRFIRAYFDDGTPLGVRSGRECHIDAIAQSFSTLPDNADPAKSKTALLSAYRLLFNKEDGVVRLLWPPFEQNGSDAGYIRSYLPGIRENGGQYTHGGIWLAMGCFNSGLNEEAYTLMDAMLPGGRDWAVYKTEPYVLTADVYYNPQHIGRGGWSWYTGASGWYFRVALEHLLGIRIQNGLLTVRPQIPQEWDGYEAELNIGNTSVSVNVRRGQGHSTHPKGLMLAGAGEHEEIEVWL